MKAAQLPDRGVVKVAGDDARKFLNGLVTTDVGRVTPAVARFGALLTPQGKIIADFFVVEMDPAEGNAFFLDCPRSLVATLVGRLNLYKLRAKVTVEDLSEALAVVAAWDGEGDTDCGLVYRDPRLSELGLRALVPPHLVADAAVELAAELVDAGAYEAHRIALGVPRGGIDFMYGDAFPHEACMDQLAGVDFDKGCYIGQEVVSRMEHRGTARTRVVGVAYDSAAPEAGASILAGEKTLGTMGSSAGGRGIATLRLDRMADAFAAGTALTAGGIAVHPFKPGWARFSWPEAARAAE
jgi:folate-binding protein YgfZ